MKDRYYSLYSSTIFDLLVVTGFRKDRVEHVFFSNDYRLDPIIVKSLMCPGDQ